MELKSKILITSLVIVWLSVFIKYRSQASDNDEENDEKNTRRIRKTIGNVFQRRSDKDESNKDAAFRFRQTIKDGVRKIEGKLDKRTSKSTSKPTAQPSRPSLELIRKPSNIPANFLPKEIPTTTNINIKDQSKFNKPTQFSKIEELVKKIASANRQINQPPQHHFDQGLYNNYKYRPDGYLKGKICRNYIEYDGVVLGKFHCPVEGFNEDEIECCGGLNEQYCCKPTEKIEKTGEDRFVLFKSYYVIIISVVFGLIFSVGVGIGLFFLCRKNKNEAIKEENESLTEDDEEREDGDVEEDEDVKDDENEENLDHKNQTKNEQIKT